ncbi:MAG: SPOR domain-containing protein [Deltaproteobacteria bacterium]|nr:SPOR domain-containing protein [Deltaproteobacteria bacterium]
MSRSEPELYKDKIEVSLDGRQIFYLFFGGAVIACLVFVLGVLVGKRVEARAHVDRPGTTAARDPLAAIDALDAQGKPGAPAPGPTARAIGELEQGARAARAAAPAVRDEDDAPRDKSDRSVADKAADKADKAADKSDKAEKADKAKADKAADKSDKAEKADKAADKSDKSDKSDKAKADKTDKARDKDKADPDADHADSDDAPAAHPDEHAAAKKRYTLQLSSFRDKAEAESFLSSVKDAGYSPYLVVADVDGKGTFYRVRLGSYASSDAANDAKEAFEAKAKKSAYVTKL